MLFGDCAGTVVGVRYEDAESPLAQARRNRGFFPVSGSFFLDVMGFPIQVIKLLTLPTRSGDFSK